ncbi:MAG: hypothetical protein AAGA92_05610 [Planctomycetota bacterium]
MRKHLTVLIVAATCLIAGVAPAAQEPAPVPKNALAYLLIKSPSETSDAASRLAQSVGVPLPNLMPLVAAAGLGRGVDQRSEWVFAVLPGTSWLYDPVPMLVLPVSDYQEFADAVQADPSGALCSIQLMGEEVLVGRRGDHAMLMNAEHRNLLTGFLRYESNIRPTMQRVEATLDDCGAVLVFTRGGLRAMLQPRPKAAPPGAGDGGYAAAVHKAFWPYAESLGVLARPLKLQARGAAIGFGIDPPQANQAPPDQPETLRVKWAVDFPARPSAATPGGEAARQARVDWMKTFPEKPLVAAAGGPVSPAGAERFVQTMIATERRDAAASGFGQFGAEEWQLIERCYRDLATGVRRLAVVVRNPAEDESLFAALAARVSVDDPDAYLEQIRSYCAAAQKINERADTDIRLEYEIQERPFSDDQGLTVEVDLLQGAGDENNAVWQLWLQKFLGADRKLRVFFGPNGEEEVVVALQSEQLLDKLIEGPADGGENLTDHPLTKKTLALMGDNDGWSALVSPSGYAALFQRLIEILSGGWGAAPQMPKFPDCPPIGISTQLNNGNWSGEIVATLETLQATVKFAREAGMRQPR